MLWYSNAVILQFFYPLILWYFNPLILYTVILHYFATLIFWYYVALILGYLNTPLIWNFYSLIHRYFDTSKLRCTFANQNPKVRLKFFSTCYCSSQTMPQILTPSKNSSGQFLKKIKFENCNVRVAIHQRLIISVRQRMCPIILIILINSITGIWLNLLNPIRLLLISLIG